MRHRIGRLVEKLPPEVMDDPDVQKLREMSCMTHMHIAHLIYRPGKSDLASKDYEFSRSTMGARWLSAYETAAVALQSEAWRKRGRATDGVAVYDLSKLAAAVAAVGA
jgi:NTE family protein